MEGFDQERRGLFDGLTVPQSLRAVLLASLGLFVYWLGIVGLEHLAPSAIPGDGPCRVIAGMLGNLSSRLGPVGAVLADLGGWENRRVPYDVLVWGAFWGWTAVVWAFFAAAIQRIAAIKLAREETIELGEALRFATRKFLPNLLSVALVFALIGFFWFVTNAGVAGGVGRIPYVGEVVVGLLFGAVLISSFLIVFVAVLGLFGFNLASAAIATEASDTFDGVSRAWNYVLARPWQVLLTLTATFLYMGIVVFFGQYFLKVGVKSLSVGWWGMGESARQVELDDELRADMELPPAVRSVFVPGKAEFIERRVLAKHWTRDGGKIYYPQGLQFALERYRQHVGAYPPTLEALLAAPAGVQGWHGPYLDGAELPLDPWGKPFVYEQDVALPDGYTLISGGGDGDPSTPGDNLAIEDVEERVGPRGPLLDVAPALEGTLGFAAGAIGFWIMLARMVLYGYVVAYFLSAQTTLYFLLRKDVEADDYTEVTLEDEEEEEPAELTAASGAQATAGKPLPSAGDDDEVDPAAKV